MKRLKAGLPVDEKKKLNMIDLIVNKGELIEKFFMVAVVLSCIAACFIGVNCDMSKYLPSYASSREGLDLMKGELGYPGTARVMMGPVSLYRTKIYKDKIAAVDGMDMVIWMDTITNIYGAQYFIEYENTEDCCRDECTVMDVIFEEEDSSELTKSALNEMKIVTGDKGYFMDSAVQSKSLSETLIKGTSMALVMGVIMIAVILCLTTTSRFEPVLFLMVVGITIIINMGTDLMIGTVSFITFSVAPILQLAVAMGYSVFLLHSFTKMKLKELSVEEATMRAIRSSLPLILASGTTTIIRFIVLMLMRFSIRWDLGFMLAKGIAISLVTILFLMSALILRFSGLIGQTEHKSFVPPFHKMGNFMYRIRHVVLVVMAVLMVPMFVTQNINRFTFGNSALSSGPGTAAYEDEQAINSQFGKSDLILAVVPSTDMVTERKMSEEIGDLYYTKSVTSPVGTLPERIPVDFLPESTTSTLHTENYSRVLIYIRTKDESDFAFQCPDEIRGVVTKCYPEGSYVTGVTLSIQGIRDIITEDYGFINILPVIGVVLVVAVTFHSAIAPIIMLIPIEIAIFFNMAIPCLTGDMMLYIGCIIVSCLQLGATVDYSILMANNYMDVRKKYPDERTRAVRHMMSQSASSIPTSGSILIIMGHGLYKISSVTAIGGLGHLIGREAFVGVILVLFLLPILLVGGDRWLVRSEKRPKKPIKERWREMTLRWKEKGREKVGEDEDHVEEEK